MVNTVTKYSALFIQPRRSETRYAQLYSISVQSSEPARTRLAFEKTICHRKTNDDTTYIYIPSLTGHHPPHDERTPVIKLAPPTQKGSPTGP